MTCCARESEFRLNSTSSIACSSLSKGFKPTVLNVAIFSTKANLSAFLLARAIAVNFAGIHNMFLQVDLRIKNYINISSTA